LNVLLLSIAQVAEALLEKSLLLTQAYNLPLGLLTLLTKFVLLLINTIKLGPKGGEFVGLLVTIAFGAALVDRRQHIINIGLNACGARTHTEDARKRDLRSTGIAPGSTRK
jgi:hypothetical protein